MPSLRRAHDPATSGRFCDSCAMSVPVKIERPPTEEEADRPRTVRCRCCGIDAVPPRCPACGIALSDPDD